MADGRSQNEDKVVSMGESERVTSERDLDQKYM
jgi:hypothetical protein